MAKSKAKAAKKSGGKLRFFTTLLIIAVATPFMMPTVFLILVGLIPTYVALSTDDDAQKSGAVSVGAMNCAGVVPFIIDLWGKGQTMGSAIQIMGRADTWFVILGAAAIGQLIVYTVPHAIATLTLTQVEARAKHLRKNLDALKESWGPDVATAKPIDQIVKG